MQLKDVADVFDDVENQRAAAWSNGVRSVLIIVRRQPGANIIETNDLVKALLPALATSISPAVKIEVALDRTQTIRGSVRRRAGVAGPSACSWWCWSSSVFLRTWRATAIPSVAVPLSLVGTFGVMYLLDYSLDNLSLMALTISTGFVVDDAIVVTENISRFVEMGDAPMDAALKGAKQIGFTIVSITVSLLAVFIPILMMGGIVGRLFREFAVTLSVAIGVSAVVSLTLTPMMASRLLKHVPDDERGWFYRWSERGFDWLLARLRDGAQVGAPAPAHHAGRHAGHRRAHRGPLHPGAPRAVPAAGHGAHPRRTEAAQDVSFPAMKAAQEKVNKVVEGDPDIAHTLSFTGGLGGSGTTNTGTIFIDLKPKPARKASSEEIIARLRGKLAKVEGINLFLQSVQDVRVGGRSSKTQYQYTLQDADLDELKAWSPKVLDRLKKIDILKDVNTDQQTAGLELRVNIDRDTASRMGITAQLVDDSLYDAFGQREVALNYTQMNQYWVVLEVKPEFQTGPESLKDIYVKSPHHRRRGAAQQLQQGDHRHHLAGDQPPGAVPLRDHLLQPAAGRGPQPGHRRHRRRRARDRRAALDGRRVRRAPRRPSPRPCAASRTSSRPRSSPSTSCSACSTRATSTRSRSSARCRRPASARSWRSSSAAPSSPSSRSSGSSC